MLILSFKYFFPNSVRLLNIYSASELWSFIRFLPFSSCIDFVFLLSLLKQFLERGVTLTGSLHQLLWLEQFLVFTFHASPEVIHVKFLLTTIFFLLFSLRGLPINTPTISPVTGRCHPTGPKVLIPTVSWCATLRWVEAEIVTASAQWAAASDTTRADPTRLIAIYWSSSFTLELLLSDSLWIFDNLFNV